jgi:hypothetical protein
MAAGDGLGTAAGIKELLHGAVRRVYSTGTERLNGAIADEIADAVFRRLPLLEQKVTRLRNATNGAEPTPSVVFTVLEEFTRAYSRAEGDKRRLLLNALNNAFDQAIYEEGMTRRLLTTIDELDYGDLHYLTTIADASLVKRTPWSSSGSMDAYHASRLQNVLLVHRQEQHSAERGISDSCHVTTFGQRMVKLIREAPPDDALSG